MPDESDHKEMSVYIFFLVCLSVCHIFYTEDFKEHGPTTGGMTIPALTTPAPEVPVVFTKSGFVVHDTLMGQLMFHVAFYITV